MLNVFFKVNIFFRSLAFSIYSVTTIILYSLLCVLALPFPLRFRHYLIRTYLRFYMVVFSKLCQVRYEIEGLQHIPKDRPGIILSKHQSTWETFFLPTVFHDPAIIIKRELLWIPFFGWGLAASDPISINRSRRSSAMQQIIVKGKKCLEMGRWILIFPEGTRVAPGTVGNYKLGGPRLASATGYPIIPVAHNAGSCWPKRQFIKRPGTIKVVIGPLIESEGRTPEELLNLTKSWIENTMLRIDGFVDKPTN